MLMSTAMHTGGEAGLQTPPEGDMGILRDLLEGQGVTGALDHSKIEGANSREARSADAQAARVAQRAAEELRRSRVARQVSVQSFALFDVAEVQKDLSSSE